MISDGRIQWIIDAYTTTNRYPYGETAETEQPHRGQRPRPRLQLRAQLGEGGGRRLRRHRRLLRHAGRRPDHRGLPRRLPEPVQGLRGHARGPAGRTSATRRTCSGCRPTCGPATTWRSPAASTRATTTGTSPATPAPPARARARASRTPRARPSPRATPASTPTTCSPSCRGPTEPEFILLRPFVPTSREDDSQLLTAFMVGKSDGDDYGKLQVFVMPRGNLPDGPAIVQGNIQSDGAVSRAGDAARQRRARRVSFGSLTAIPIDGGLVYVRPFYVTSDETEIPNLESGDRLLRGRGRHRAAPSRRRWPQCSASRPPRWRSHPESPKTRRGATRGHRHPAGLGSSSRRRRRCTTRPRTRSQERRPRALRREDRGVPGEGRRGRGAPRRGRRHRRRPPPRPPPTAPPPSRASGGGGPLAGLVGRDRRARCPASRSGR